MKIVYIILFFVIYHFVFNFLFKILNNSKGIRYLKKISTFSVLFLGFLLPVLLLLSIFGFDNYKNLLFLTIPPIMYTKYFFNYKILKKSL